MNDGAETSDSGFRLITLRPSYDALGRVLELLSRTAPFSDGTLAQTIKTVGQQIRHRRHVAAIDSRGGLVGYVGWVPTLRVSAEHWVEDRGPLQVRSKGYDALALNIVVSQRRDVTAALLRRARQSHGQVKVYFKRVYSSGQRAPRKGSVTNAAAEGQTIAKP